MATNRIGSDRQSKSSAPTVAGARLIATVETLEDLLAIGGSDANPGVNDRYTNSCIIVSDEEIYSPAGRGIQQTILYQINKRAGEQRPITDDRHFKRPGRVGKAHTTGRGEELQLIDHLFEKYAECQHFSPYWYVLASEEQEITDKTLKARELALERGRETPLFIIVGRRWCHIECRAQIRQGGTQFVRGIGHKTPLLIE